MNKLETCEHHHNYVSDISTVDVRTEWLLQTGFCNECKKDVERKATLYPDGSKMFEKWSDAS